MFIQTRQTQTANYALVKCENWLAVHCIDEFGNFLNVFA